MHNIRRVVFGVLQELEGITPKVETKNSNPLKELKGAVNVCLSEMGEITNRMLGRWRKLRKIKISKYDKIAYRLAHKYVKYLESIDHQEAFDELVAAGMEGIMQGLTSFTPGLKTKVSTFVYGRAQFAIQKQFHSMKRRVGRYVSLNAKVDEGNDETTEFQTVMSSPLNVEELVEKKMRHRALYNALAQLPREYRHIALLCSELSVSQVAQKVNKPVKEINGILLTLKAKMTKQVASTVS